MQNLLPLLAIKQGNMTLIFILLLILIFWLFMIRPQQKRQKQVDQYRNALQKGDKVITIGGIHGKITEVHETTFTIEISNDVLIHIEKAAVAIDEQELKEYTKKAKAKEEKNK